MRPASLRMRAPRFAIVTLSVCLISALGAGFLVRGGAVRAQEKASPKADAAAIVAELDDIDKLRIFNALKLQTDEIDKLISTLTAAQSDYETKVNALGASVFAASAAEVHDMKKQALGGAAIPKEFDDKMRRLQADFLKQRDDLNTANIQHIGTACRAVLTDKQVAAATKLERDQWERDHPNAKNATDTQLFNLFCLDMFISNPRAVPLLKEIRAAAK